MACAVPLISSNASSLPEVGGEAARYFNPYNVDEMVQVVRAVLQDDDLQEEMRQQGLVQATKFSWQKAAEETWAVYQSLLHS